MALETHVYTSPALTIGASELTYSPTSATLVTGDRDAVLIDTQFIAREVAALGDMIEQTGKRLTAIYITHAHGDHCLGLGTLLDRFPGAQAFSTAPVIATLKETLDDQIALYRGWFGDDVADQVVLPSALEGNVIHLEGEDLRIVMVGQGDIPDSTVVHIPSIGAVLAGDVAYNKIHPMLAMCTDEQMAEWIASLDAIEAVAPSSVVAGHKQPEASDADIQTVVDGTRAYIRDFRAALTTSTEAIQIVTALSAKYPEYGNIATLIVSARAHFLADGEELLPSVAAA